MTVNSAVLFSLLILAALSVILANGYLRLCTPDKACDLLEAQSS